MFTEGQPILHGDTVKFQLGFVLAHKTPVIARDLYFTIFLKSAPGANCKLEFRPDLSGFWTWNSAFGVRFSGFTNDQFKLAPEMLLQAGAITVYLKEPFTENFALEYFYGCSGSPIGSESVVVTPGNVASAWQTHVTPKIVSGATLPDIDRAFVGKVLPLNYGQRGCA